MSATPKIFETGGMIMELGMTGTNQSSGWGESNSPKALGATDAFPWLTFSNKLTIAKKEDDSVTTKAFSLTPRIVTKTVDNPLSFPARFNGLGRFHYWMLGFENAVVPVVAFKAGTSPFTTTPTIGDACTDTDANNFTFLRTETARDDVIIYIFRADDATPVAPTLQTGDLTEAGGSPWIFSFTSHSSLMYEHLYELDSTGRRYRTYTSAEQSALSLLTTDKRNLMCTLAKRTDTYDLRYKNAMCKGFSFKFAAADYSSWETNYMAYGEERDDYSASTWTLTSGLENGTLIPRHSEYRVNISTAMATSSGALSGFTELGISEFSLDVEIPLQSQQDTVTGLTIAEPVIEGKYGTKLTGTISRHTVQTYQTYRDAGITVIMQIAANQGWYMQEFLIKEGTFGDAGGDDSEVMMEPFTLDIGYVQGSSEWDDWLYGYTELHDSPILFRTRDSSSANEMLRMDLTTQGTAESGFTAVERGNDTYHTTIITVASTFGAIAGGAALGLGKLFYTFPAGVITVVSATISLDLDEVDGNITADTPDVGIGTTVASGAVATLDGTAAFENILTGQTAPDCNGTVFTTTDTSGLSIAAIDDHTVYLNIADTWAAGGETALPVAGTITLVWTGGA